MKVKNILLPGLLALATGCASHQAGIVFSDEKDIRAAASSNTVPVQNLLERADELAIEQVC
jgi:hypothetical protein